MTRSREVALVPIVSSFDGSLVRAIGADGRWDIEDREDSTNRLTIAAPIAEAADLYADMEIIFQRRRFRITGFEYSRQDGSVDIIGDEAQATLADNLISTYNLDGALLSQALERALMGSEWTSAGVADDSGSYHAEFEKTPTSTLLLFLQAQSGQRLRFDSLHRTVALIDPLLEPPNRVLTYGAGVSNITRTVEAPEATVIEPQGKDGMTIEQVNGGSRTVENFAWYTDLGVPLQTARKRFTKKLFWSDDRYIYANNLKRDADAKLEQMSRPAISYTVDTDPDLIDSLSLGSQVWVVDELLDVKLSTRVVRLVRSSDASDSIVELSYLPPSFSSPNQTTGDAQGGSSDDSARFLVKNEAEITLTNVPAPVLTSSIQVYAATSFQIGLTVRWEATGISQPTLVDGYLLLDGEKLDEQVMVTMHADGWATVGLPVLTPGIQEGTHTLDFYMSIGSGAATVPLRAASLWLIVRGAYGGVSNERPDRRVADDIPTWLTLKKPVDSVDIIFPTNRPFTASDDLGTWLNIPAPVDSAVVLLNPTITVTGATVEMIDMVPGQTISLLVTGADEFSQTGIYAADINGAATIDLATDFSLIPGDYQGEVLEFGQTFLFTV